LFSRDGGKTPISRAQVTGAFRKALTTMDIDREEQKKRGLTFHSWRHFFNTSLLLANVPAAKVQEMTGHISLKMTRKYTQIKGSDLDDITTVQERLLV
jgi:integrase